MNFLPGQKEVALVIAHSSRELLEFTELLNGSGYTSADSISELLDLIGNGQETYMLADGTDMSQAKAIYDFAIQYPTGQIQIWDKIKCQLVSVSPEYQSGNIFLTTTHNLQTLEGWGFDLKRNCGLAYQT